MILLKLCIPLTSLELVLSSQAVFINTRTCIAKQDLCTASVDSVMEIEACALSQYSKGHLLYSTATTQSTMDYSCKAVEEDVVDSPPSGAVISVAINSPSPLQGKETEESSKWKCWDTNGAQRTLNLGLSHSPNSKLHKVGLLYRLPSSASQWFFVICISKFIACI